MLGINPYEAMLRYIVFNWTWKELMSNKTSALKMFAVYPVLAPIFAFIILVHIVIYFIYIGVAHIAKPFIAIKKFYKERLSENSHDVGQSDDSNRVRSSN